MRPRILSLLIFLGLAAVAAAQGAAPPARDIWWIRDLPGLRELVRYAETTRLDAAPAADRGPAATPVSPPPPVAPAASPRVADETCVAVASPSPVPADPLPSAEPPGAVETTTVDRFTDDYLYSPNGELKVGTRREWGSTVVFYGLADGNPGFNDTNTIDANDNGRELQVALYDYPRLRQSCAWNASCVMDVEEGCGKEITFLGWNPVQGGNECERGSGTESVVVEPGRLEAAVVPLFWNPDWRRQDCENNGCSTLSEEEMRSDVRYRQRVRFIESNVVEILMEYTNLSPIDHSPTNQEFPTLYSSFGKVGQDLRVILDSRGDEVSVDVPANDGFFTKKFSSPGGFAALQNEARDYGVGLYYESRQREFQAWQLIGQFNNFRALYKFGLPALATVRARAYLILGSFEAIAEAAARIDRRISPFGELETPAPDATVGDSLWLSGWTLDNGQVERLEVLVDGVPVATGAPSVRRPDVCALWVGYDMCAEEVGYALRVDLSEVSRCAHLLEVRATDDDGNRRTIARRRIFVDDRACSEPRCEERPPATHPVFRFFWSGAGDADHQFSRFDEAPPQTEPEGIAFELFTEPAAGRLPLWQVWCDPCTDHLQTTIGGEGEPYYSGGVLLGYCAKARTRQAPRRLQRLWSEELSDHFVSADPLEWAAAAAAGYISEGSCWVP